jgi:hypothetical protein
MIQQLLNLNNATYDGDFFRNNSIVVNDEISEDKTDDEIAHYYNKK